MKMYPITADDLGSLGVHPEEVEDMILLRQKVGHSVYRLICRQDSYILKWFAEPNVVELKTYALLEEIGIPTLPVYARSDQALLLEDLQSSALWRLANDLDMAHPTTGQAVAEWYLRLHRAGRELLATSATRLDFLQPWVDVITEENLSVAAERFEFANTPGWDTIVANFATLRDRYHALPQTLNYNDFAAENLALSRDEHSPRKAVVFDYDCFSVGAAYSDWRNVTYSLAGEAREIFVQAYGPVSAGEKWLDDVLSTLQGLVVAARRIRVPGWAAPLLKSVENGELADYVLSIR
jgi:hypothetical protein